MENPNLPVWPPRNGFYVGASKMEGSLEFAERLRQFIGTLIWDISPSDDRLATIYAEFDPFIHEINRNTHGDCRELRDAAHNLLEAAFTGNVFPSLIAKICVRLVRKAETTLRDDYALDQDGKPIEGARRAKKEVASLAQGYFEQDKDLEGLPLLSHFYLEGMLTLRIMHEIILTVLDFEGHFLKPRLLKIMSLLDEVEDTMKKEEAGPAMISVYRKCIHELQQGSAIQKQNPSEPTQGPQADQINNQQAQAHNEQYLEAAENHGEQHNCAQEHSKFRSATISTGPGVTILERALETIESDNESTDSGNIAERAPSELHNAASEGSGPTDSSTATIRTPAESLATRSPFERLAAFMNRITYAIDALPSGPTTEEIACDTVKGFREDINENPEWLQIFLLAVKTKSNEDREWARTTAVSLYNEMDTSYEICEKDVVTIKEHLLCIAHAELVEPARNFKWNCMLFQLLHDLQGVDEVLHASEVCRVVGMMVNHASLFYDDNLSTCVSFIEETGDLLDQDCPVEFNGHMHQLGKRTYYWAPTNQLIVVGLFKLRDKGWDIRNVLLPD